MLPFLRLVSLCTFLVIAPIAAFAADGPTPGKNALDGLRFKGEIGQQGKGDHQEDTIFFEDGRFRSLGCEKWGFSPASYSVKKEGESYHFSATLQSPDKGTLEWKGTITGDKAKANFRWLKKRWYWTIDRQYWFKGKPHASQ